MRFYQPHTRGQFVRQLLKLHRVGVLVDPVEHGEDGLEPRLVALQLERVLFDRRVEAFRHLTAGDGGIRATNELPKLLEEARSTDLEAEVESRWRLVETAWELGVSKSVLRVDYDEETERLFVDSGLRRKSVTSCRPALNGYQRGLCFYCGSKIHVDGSGDLPDVDHFFPHLLKRQIGPAVDGVWNLVLACRACNRGAGGKFERAPSLRLLALLHTRNEYLISSHHALRETLIQQTGKTEALRRSFLNEFHQRAVGLLLHTWEPH